MRHVGHNPESDESNEAVDELLGALYETLSPERVAAIARMPAHERMAMADQFQLVMNTIRLFLHLAERTERHGGRARWRIPLAAAVERLERALEHVGVRLTAAFLEMPTLYRDSRTGALHVAGTSPLAQYIAHAVKDARPRELEEGGWVVELDGFPGVWADGDTPEDCLHALAEVLEDWLKIKLVLRDGDVPVVAGINLEALLPPR